MSIPKIFHQIWIQGEMPEPYRYFRDHLLDLHPGWEYRFWTDENRPKLFNEKIYRSYTKPCFKSDILRYELLAQYGGVYIDSDFLFMKNIEPLLFGKDILLMKGTCSNKITNGVMGCVKDHPLINFLIYNIPVSYENYLRSKKTSEIYDGLRTVGPRFIDRVVEEYYPDEIPKALDTKYFLPRTEKNPKVYEPKRFPEAYALHFGNNGQGSDDIVIHKTLPRFNPNKYTSKV
jgi:hypothetical protein